ncbi:MAG: DinB family protein [Thermomicrobiales bacterium]|nr:DinB family protein [Thermomicrobiales bacterium]
MQIEPHHHIRNADGFPTPYPRTIYHSPSTLYSPRKEGESMDVYDRLLQYDEWATHELFAASSDLLDEQLDREFDIGHRTVRATFDHLITVIQGWMIEMGGQPGGSPPGGDSSLAALRVRFDGAHEAFSVYVRSLRDTDRLEDRFADDYGGSITQIGAALHVLLHNVEHRSEILHLLQRLKIPDVPEIDLALWEIQRIEATETTR